MSARVKQTLLFVLAAAFLFGSGRLEKILDHDRDALGLTISEPLQDAPPVLALTTQALGGFRGLISNLLWMRANDLQINDQYFEAAQLSDWITDLEPHFTQVWIYEAWNMAYNISVKFPGFADRWRWVENGIELLRDRGLRYNPNDLLIYRELAWFYQHKMGANLDDANEYYKTEWASEMNPFFGPQGTNFDLLIHPQTAQERTNAFILKNTYKIDPVFAKKVNDEWGPLDWRLPEAHAIYWGALGLQKAQEHPDKVVKTNIITVRRIIYQSMMQAFQHGQVIPNPFTHTAELGPNLAIISKVNDAYVSMMREQPDYAQHISIGHRNFVLDAVYFLYEYDHLAEARQWYKYLADTYPDKPILQRQPDSFPRNVPLEEYAISRIQEDASDTSQADTTALVEGLLIHSYSDMAIGQDDRSAGFGLLARKVYEVYMRKINKYKADIPRVGLPPFAVINKNVLDRMLNSQGGLPFAARAAIRTGLRMGPEPVASSAGTSTNSTITFTPQNANGTNSNAGR